MFCPVGYVSWSEMCEMVDDWVKRMILARAFEAQGKEPSLAFESETDVQRQLFMSLVMDGNPEKDGAVERNKELNFHKDILRGWALTKVIQEFETLLCSAAGTLMRAPPMVGSHLDELQWCYPWLSDEAHSGWSLRTTTEFSNYFRILDDAEYYSPSITDRLCFVDAETGTIKIKNNSQNYLVDWQGLEETDAAKLVEIVIKPYLGWSLVWNPDEFPETLWDVLEILGIAQERWRGSTNHQSHSGKKGRRGLLKARTEFSKLSSEELSLPLKEIAILLRDRTGEHPAESTIRLWKG